MKHQLLQYKAKHGDINFFLENGEGVKEALEKIFKFNFVQNIYYDEDGDYASSLILKGQDPAFNRELYLNQVYNFMRDRAQQEYEDFEIDNLYSPTEEIE